MQKKGGNVQRSRMKDLKDIVKADKSSDGWIRKRRRTGPFNLASHSGELFRTLKADMMIGTASVQRQDRDSAFSSGSSPCGQQPMQAEARFTQCVVNYTKLIWHPKHWHFFLPGVLIVPGSLEGTCKLCPFASAADRDFRQLVVSLPSLTRVSIFAGGQHCRSHCLR